MSNRLCVAAADPTAEISVLDGRLNRVAQGVASLSAPLPPGLYKVRVRVAANIRERLVSLDEDRRETFEADEFPSPVPLLHTSRTHEYHIAAASQASRRLVGGPGTGGTVFVFVRDWTGRTAKPLAEPSNPADGLTLRRWEDPPERAVDLARAADVRMDGDPSAGWCGPAEPGLYVLALRLPDGTLAERAIHVGAKQQVQVFLLRSDYGIGEGEPERVANLGGGSVLVAGQPGFDPSDEGARLTELARHALTQGRRGVAGAVARTILDGGSCDPILALIGAHLLLRDDPGDPTLFPRVMAKAEELLGADHPDVRALRLRFDVAGQPTISLPPMLRASWDLIVAETVRRPTLIVPGSPASQVAGRILPGGTWLTWTAIGGTTGDRAEVLTGVVADYLNARAQREILRAQDRPVASPRGSAAGVESATFRSVRPRPSGRGATLGTRGGARRGLDGGHDDGDRETGSAMAMPEAAPTLGQVKSAVASGMSADEKAELARSLGLPGDLLDRLLAQVSS